MFSNPAMFTSKGRLGLGETFFAAWVNLWMYLKMKVGIDDETYHGYSTNHP